MRWSLLLAALGAACHAPGDGSSSPVGDHPLEIRALLASSPERFGEILASAEEHRLQILVAEVDEEAPGGPRLLRASFRAGPDYFYPASSIKTCAAIASLDQLAELRAAGHEVDRETPLRLHPLFEDEVLEEEDASHVDGGTITVGHEIRKLSIVSDNRAYNRLYDFLGQERLNRAMWSAGLASTRLVHRLSIARTPEENRTTRRLELLPEGGPPVELGEKVSTLRLENSDLSGVLLGHAHIEGGERVEGPFSFLEKNFMSLEDLQDMLVMLVRPDVDLGKRGFPDLEPEDRAFLLEAMAELSRESTDPLYDPEKYPDDYVKFLLPGLARVVPAENLRITNKVGLAYGFTIENAHVVDLASGREFFLAAVLYTNPDGVVNDGVYAYDEVAFPFWANLGEVVARTLWEQEDGGTQPGRRR